MKNFEIKTIVAPIDLSESSAPALRYASLLATQFSARLIVTYAEPIVYPVDYLGPAGGLYLASLPENEAALRAEVEKYAEPLIGGRKYEIDIRSGQPVPAILSLARERKADLIVAGTHLRHGWRRAILGSVSEGIIHGSTCPVLTVAVHDAYAGAPPYAITNVVCPVNFSEAARDSLVVGAALAERFDAKLTVVHVVEGVEAGEPAADEERLRNWIDPELRGRCSLRELTLRGGAAERVLDCADDIGADLVVVGAQHHLFRNATVLGSTTERLIRFASSPVLIVPRDGRVPNADVREVLEALATR